MKHILARLLPLLAIPTALFALSSAPQAQAQAPAVNYARAQAGNTARIACASMTHMRIPAPRVGHLDIELYKCIDFLVHCGTYVPLGSGVYDCQMSWVMRPTTPGGHYYSCGMSANYRVLGNRTRLISHSKVTCAKGFNL